MEGLFALGGAIVGASLAYLVFAVFGSAGK